MQEHRLLLVLGVFRCTREPFTEKRLAGGTDVMARHAEQGILDRDVCTIWMAKLLDFLRGIGDSVCNERRWWCSLDGREDFADGSRVVELLMRKVFCSVRRYGHHED